MAGKFAKSWQHCTDKKENQIFLIYKVIQSGAVAKSYMRKGFLIYMRKCENISPYMRRPLVIYDFATAPFLNFLIYEENLIFFFISAVLPTFGKTLWNVRKI
jgi:hypothetical protein